MVAQPGDAHIPEGDLHSREVEAHIDALRAAIERERQALRGASEPPEALRERVGSPGEVSGAASTLALRGFERAESRLGTLEQELGSRVARLSSDVQSVVIELRGAQGDAPAATSAYLLEGVTGIQDDMWAEEVVPLPGPEALSGGLPQVSESTAGPSAPAQSREGAVGDAVTAGTSLQPGARPPWRLVVLSATIATLALSIVWMQRRAEVRLNDTAVRLAAIERQRDATAKLLNADLNATREQAARQIADARHSALQAQVVGNVLAAPDLVRYWLTGGGSTALRPYAQVLFSRSRGMVFSAARLPSAGRDQTYQLWLLTTSGPVSAGLLTPDSAGQVNLATETPLRVPEGLTGAAVTLEPPGGGDRPSGASVLLQAPAPRPIEGGGFRSPSSQAGAPR